MRTLGQGKLGVSRIFLQTSQLSKRQISAKLFNRVQQTNYGRSLERSNNLLPYLRPLLLKQPDSAVKLHKLLCHFACTPIAATQKKISGCEKTPALPLFLQCRRGAGKQKAGALRTSPVMAGCCLDTLNPSVLRPKGSALLTCVEPATAALLPGQPVNRRKRRALLQVLCSLTFYNSVASLA